MLPRMRRLLRRLAHAPAEPYSPGTALAPHRLALTLPYAQLKLLQALLETHVDAVAPSSSDPLRAKLLSLRA